MAFDYSQTGLPENQKWQMAAAICHNWVDHNMGRNFDKESLNSFILSQPVKAAKMIVDNYEDYSEESVTVALLGPAKVNLLSKQSMWVNSLGPRAVALGKHALEESVDDIDDAIRRDADRLFIAEGIVTLLDQIIEGDVPAEKHEACCNIVLSFEAELNSMEDDGSKLYKEFVDIIVQAKDVLNIGEKGKIAS